MTDKDSNTHLKKKAVRGGAITLSAQLLVILTQLISIVTLSRLLSPSDFGLIAMITAVTAFIGLFRDMGLSSASIQSGSLNHAQTNLLFWVNVFAGALLTATFALLAPVLAWFYKRPEIESLAILLSILFVVSSIGAQPSAILQREMRFRYKAVADVAGSFSSLSLSVFLAIEGFGVWSLAWGNLIGAMVTTAILFLSSGFRPTRPKGANNVKRMFGFGANVTLFEIVNYFHRNADHVLIGRAWGAEILGYYSRAYQIMMLPIVSLRTPINAVAFPLLSSLKNDPKEFRFYYCRISSLLAFLSMPVMAFLVINSESVISIALGERWAEVGPIFFFLGLSGFIQPVVSLRGLVLLSLGFSKRYLLWGVINTSVVMIAFLVGVVYGPTEVAIAYALVNYAIVFPSMMYIFEGTPISTRDFINSVWLPFSASLVAAVASFVISSMFPQGDFLRSILSSAAIFTSVFIGLILVTPAGRKSLVAGVSLFKYLMQK